MKLEQIRKLTDLKTFPEGNQKEQVLIILKELGIDQSALYQELEMSSRFVNTHRDVSNSTDRVQLHSHSFYEILYIRSSGGVQYLVGTDRYLLQRGDVILVPPGVGHRPLLTDHLSEPYTRDVLWLSQEFMDLYCRMFRDLNAEDEVPTLIRTAGTQWEDLLRDRFRNGVREEETKSFGWEAMVLGNTVQLMVLLWRAIADRGREPMYVEKPELLEEVLAYVERHLGDHITLSATAQRFFVSESKISQTFREKMGVSFYRCVTQRRLIAAKNLITEGLGLEAVSIQVGFRDYSSFYRAFRQEFGISPRQYRKIQLEEENDRGVP